jgi:Nucleotidyltransferase of unknown function (DUF6036)
MATLQALQRLIDGFENQGVIIGGVAVSLLGKPRFTADADAVILISIADLGHLLSAAEREGFEPRVPNYEELAHKSRILLLRHRLTAITCDISLGALPFEKEMVDRSRLVPVGRLRLRLPSVEDLIIMKAVAHRPKDLLDIQTLVEIHPDLDRSRIEHWVRQFAELLEMPELWTDVAAILQRA